MVALPNELVAGYADDLGLAMLSARVSWAAIHGAFVLFELAAGLALSMAKCHLVVVGSDEVEVVRGWLAAAWP
eukprot:9068455-Lingulodinium_polyedra.AAC.1